MSVRVYVNARERKRLGVKFYPDRIASKKQTHQETQGAMDGNLANGLARIVRSLAESQTMRCAVPFLTVLDMDIPFSMRGSGLYKGATLRAWVASSGVSKFSLKIATLPEPSL